MHAFSPKCLAYDAAHGITYLTATYGKQKYLLTLDDDMHLAVVRSHTAPPDNPFWVHDGVVVFWSLGKTIVVPLAPAAKAKTLALPEANAAYHLHAAFAPQPIGIHAVLDRSVHRFAGDRWIAIDGTGTPQGRVVRATLRGAYVRAIGDGVDAWTPLVEGQAVRATVAISGERALIAGFGGSLVIGLDGSAPQTLPRGNWCSVGHADGFFAWSDRAVWAIDRDGAVRDTGITTGDEAADRCLFRCGASVYFVQRGFVHRYRDGAWSKHDLADDATAIGLT